MAFLNIEAKLRETVIDGAPLMSFVRARPSRRGGSRVRAVRRRAEGADAALDRFCGGARPPAPKALPDLPAHPDSWKHTRFAEGNVQLSFSEDAAPFPVGATRRWCIPPTWTSISAADSRTRRSGSENNVFRPGHKTNQALVYALLFAQGILPRYTLDPAPATTRRAAPRLRSYAPAPQRRTSPRSLKRPGARGRRGEVARKSRGNRAGGRDVSSGHQRADNPGESEESMPIQLNSPGWRIRSAGGSRGAATAAPRSISRSAAGVSDRRSLALRKRSSSSLPRPREAPRAVGRRGCRGTDRRRTRSELRPGARPDRNPRDSPSVRSAHVSSAGSIHEPGRSRSFTGAVPGRDAATGHPRLGRHRGQGDRDQGRQGGRRQGRERLLPGSWPLRKSASGRSEDSRKGG